MQNVIQITPETFDPVQHQLPTAGELLLTGAYVKIDAEGKAYTTTNIDDAHGVVIELCKPGQMVEVAAMGEQQEDGGFYFEKICVLETTS